MLIKPANLKMEQDGGKRRVKVLDLANWARTLGIRSEREGRHEKLGRREGSDGQLN